MSEAEDRRLIEAVLAAGVKIPPMPNILLKVLALDRDPDAGPRQYAAVIARDPALAGALYRVAGSPVMGLRGKVDSLDKAITVLGIRTTVAVVRSEALRNALHDPGLSAVMANLWIRMNAIADCCLVALRLARLRGVREDFAFQLGIFHDCGLAVLCRRHASYAQAFHHTHAWPDLAALDAAHQTNHMVVGQMVARSWQLPPEVALAVRHHHDHELAALPEGVARLIILLQFAFHVIAQRRGGDDSAWPVTWQAPATELFAQADADIGALEARLLGSAKA